MKLSKIIFLIVFMCPVVQALSQSYTDYIVIDEFVENISDLQTEFANQANVYWIEETSSSAIEQISKAAENLQIQNLHIYVSTKPGAIVFSSIAITGKNIDDLAVQLSAWSRAVSDQVLIHSEVVFSGEEGNLLKQRLEEITGVVFTTQN